MNQLTNKKLNDLLQQLLLQIKDILSDQLIGIYVGGSIANECFDQSTSDIDCYVITNDFIPEKMIKKIEYMHKNFYSTEHLYAKKIEISYIPQKHLFNLDPNNIRPYFNEGNFYLARYGSNFIIELHLLREKGICIVGPDIKSFIQKISLENLKLAIKKNLHEYWEPVLQDREKLSRSDYQVFAIFTMCRTLFSLETGDITSKIEAANLAISKIDKKWKSLIEQAVTWQPNKEINQLEATKQFVRYVINKSDE